MIFLPNGSNAWSYQMKNVALKNYEQQMIKALMHKETTKNIRT
jgi:hypothetical protein